MRDKILHHIKVKPGITGGELALKIMSDLGPSNVDLVSIGLIIEAMVMMKEIVEVCFLVPNGRRVLVYFPQGTYETILELGAKL